METLTERRIPFSPGRASYPRAVLQGCTRLAVKLDFLAGLHTQGVGYHRLEGFFAVSGPAWGNCLHESNMMWALTDSMVHNPDPWIGGTVLPNANAGLSYRWFATVGYPRVKEIIEQDLGSALIYLNSHAVDFKNPGIRQYLDKYLRGSNGYDATNRAKVMKLLVGCRRH